MEIINGLVKDNKVIESLEACITDEYYYLGMVLASIFQEKNQSDYDTETFKNIVNNLKTLIAEDELYELIIQEQEKKDDDEERRLNGDTQSEPVKEQPPVYDGKIRVLMFCNWCSSQQLCDTWNKMSKGDYTWDNIKMVSSEPCDYYCVINRTDQPFIPEKTIYFRMEPNMQNHPHMWGDWADVSKLKEKYDFKYIGDHKTEYNNNEWHLSQTYNQLISEPIVKDETLSLIVSSVLSDKYNDPGHIRRIDFMKFVEGKGDIKLNIYGGDKFLWKDYKGALPYHQKDKALFPYKYTFNCENFSIKNYYTEKIIDAVLSECLIFYSGCYNAREFIDDRAFVYLELSNFEQDYQTIKKAIAEDWWSQRIEYIREAKKKILNELQFFPRLQKLLN